ncbi:hypothetical protein [Actinacidiphila sp. ITFR-21]|uniref:hypothetical protein n=1 Tax=Actinacidiphila sp. ITFR-21 TaxID=3075199 RepID=UPI00288A66D8|nr:hypothetical protein [Streptomyces sp. ITFR-21]WNI17094.1 hypothetical protein RLT57_17255 [Streptomyces sp. ITFR-21]
MPTPHGTRGGMAFSAEELRVVRRALAEVLHPSRSAAVPAVPRPAEYVKDCLRLAAAIAEAEWEAERLSAFLLAELRRYRDALPGGSAGYLERLDAALADGYVPGPDDLAALRRLRSTACAAPEHLRRTALLRRCETLAENDVRPRLEVHMPAPRRLLTLLPARPSPAQPSLADEPRPKPEGEPAEQPRPPRAPRPPQTPQTPPNPADPADPGRRTPTPAEIWPPHRRRPAPGRPDQARSA